MCIRDIETNLIVSPNKGSLLVSSVDRESRSCCLDKIENRKLAYDTVAEGLSNISFEIFSVTSDNGTKFTDHMVIVDKLETKYYFTDPYSSYQRGNVEQLNGLIRRFIPKGTHIDSTDQSLVKMVEK